MYCLLLPPCAYLPFKLLWTHRAFLGRFMKKTGSNRVFIDWIGLFFFEFLNWTMGCGQKRILKKKYQIIWFRKNAPLEADISAFDKDMVKSWKLKCIPLMELSHIQNWSTFLPPFFFHYNSLKKNQHNLKEMSS